MLRHAPQPDSPPRRGVVLIAVLVVVVLLTLAAYQYSQLMMAEYKAAVAFTRASQARAAAESGVNFAAMALSDPEAFTSILGGNPYDNESAFSSVPVGKPINGRQAYFSIVAPLGPDDSPTGTLPFRYGATDESGKLNLNALLQLDSSGALAVQILGKMGMPEETANAILDWIDTDSTPRTGGAEDDHYSQLEPSYRCKNGPLDTIEELLSVRGITPDMVFGNDRNRNGILDAEEKSTGDARDLGWQAYLTVYSREQNVSADGKIRLYINTRNTLTLHQKLIDAVGQEMAYYILAYRRYGAAPAMPGGGGRVQNVSATAITRQDLQLNLLNGGNNVPSLFELVGTSIQLPAANPQQPARRIACPLNDTAQQRELLPKVLDRLTTNADQDMPARVNVNTAPRAVLLALPGLTETEAESIVSSRPDPSSLIAPDPIYQTTAWLLTEANLKIETMRTLDRFVTARTQVYRVQVLGHFEGGGPSVRVEAVIDTNRGRPRVVYWRDLSELGRGFTLPKMGTQP